MRSGEAAPIETLHMASTDQTLPKKLGRSCLRLAALGLAGAGVGAGSMFVLPTETEIGPHRAEVTLSGDELAEFDLGMPGSISLPIPNSLGLGATVEIKESPTIVSEAAGQVKFTDNDVKEYIHFFGNFEADIADLRSDLINTWLWRSSLASVSILAAYGTLGKTRRKELMDDYITPVLHSRMARIGLASCLALSVTNIDSMSGADTRGVAVSEVFNDTPLEGAYVEGKPLQIIINKYGKDALRYWQSHQEYYEQVNANLRESFQKGTPLGHESNSKLALFFTDLHCNTGMAEVIGQAAELYQPNWVINAGDTTMSGTPMEDFCIRDLTRSLGDVEHVIALGNHDDAEVTGQQLEKRNGTVLAGRPVKVSGLTFLGDTDPRRSIFGQTTKASRNETVAAMSSRMARQACNGQGTVNVLVVHEPKAGQAVASRGCADVVLSGHMHHQNILFENSLDGPVLQLTGGTSGGVDKDRPPVGPVQKEAPFYIIEFDSETNAVKGYQTITVQPNASVELSAPIYVDTPSK